VAPALSPRRAGGRGALGLIITIFHDDRGVHRVNIRLDVHGVNVVGNRSVMGEQTSRHCSRTTTSSGWIPRSLRYATVRPGGSRNVASRSQRRSTPLQATELGELRFTRMAVALEFATFHGAQRENKARNEKPRFAQSVF
jgi:hypothetical protein